MAPPAGGTFSFSLKVTCVRCGTARELPESNEANGLMGVLHNGVTVGTADRCRCGAKRVKITPDIE